MYTLDFEQIGYIFTNTTNKITRILMAGTSIAAIVLIVLAVLTVMK